MYPDAVAGIYGCAAILTALHHRNRSGRGQYIDLSMQEANLTFVGDAAVEFLRTGRERARQGNRHPDFAPHGIYACSGEEQWLAIACESEAQWRSLCRLAGHDEWLEDPRFVDSAARKAAEDALDRAIGAWTRGRERDSLVALLAGAGVIAAPVLDAREVAQDVHLRDREMVVAVDHAEAGTWFQAVNPWRFSRTPASSARAAPLLGEHTQEVLSELLGMSAAEYQALVAAGVSGTVPPREGATTP